MDWKKLIADLSASGMTQQEIAKKAGVGQSAISELATGTKKEVLYSTGRKLEALHAKLPKRRPAKVEG